METIIIILVVITIVAMISTAIVEWFTKRINRKVDEIDGNKKKRLRN